MSGSVPPSNAEFPKKKVQKIEARYLNAVAKRNRKSEDVTVQDAKRKQERDERGRERQGWGECHICIASSSTTATDISMSCDGGVEGSDGVR